MSQAPRPGRPNLPQTPVIGDDPDGGQVMGPYGESPEDPAARWLFRGCLFVFLAVGLAVGLFALLYRWFTGE